MRRVILLLAFAVLGVWAMSLTACNTIHGVGSDIQDASSFGRKIVYGDQEGQQAHSVDLRNRQASTQY